MSRMISFLLERISVKFDAHKLKLFIDIGFIIIEKILIKFQKLHPLYFDFYDEMTENEINLADSAGVKLKTTPIALDAFVFIVNVENPVNSLTVKEIQNIYTGNITYWNEVGGTNTEINPYQRNPNSGSQELMLSLVMKDLTMMDFPEMILFGMMGPINRITHDKNGLGYTVYFFEQFMAPNDSLKLLAVNGIIPEYNTLKKRIYIYTTDVYVVIREDLDWLSIAYQLYRWLLTDDGQSVVEESGYIPYY